MKYFLGIDGGGTKTKFVLCNELGITIAESTQPTCHYLQCGLNGLTQVFKDGLYECIKNSNIKDIEITNIFAACAGYGDIEADNHKILKAVENAFGTTPFCVGNDTENALAGSLAGQPGINIIAGTGSIGLGINEYGESFRSGGWHHIFGGDEGSAYWIATNLLRLYTRQSDGRDKKTELYEYIKEKMHWIHDSDMLSECIIEWDFDRTKIASLATFLYDLAKKGDPYAIQLYKDAAKELGDIVLAIHSSLKIENKILVSYSGGVFNSGDYILKPLQKYLSGIDIRLIDPILTPDKGSVLLAMKHSDIPITKNIIEHLKSNLQPPF